MTTQNNQLTNQNSRFEAEINKLKTTPKFNSSETQFDETESIRQKLSYFQTSAKPIEPKPEWELNKYGKIGWAITLIYSVCCVLRLARFNLTKFEPEESWKQNYFEGVPSPIGALLILSPLVLELTELNFLINNNYLVPLFTLVVAVLLISKIPTYSFKKIKIKPALTVFILLAIGISLVTLMFFTFETLLIFSFFYILSIPMACFTYLSNKKSVQIDNSEDDHEDIL